MIGTLTERAPLYIAGGMVKGCARVGSLLGGGSVAGNGSGGNLNSDRGIDVIFTAGAELVILAAGRTEAAIVRGLVGARTCKLRACDASDDCDLANGTIRSGSGQPPSFVLDNRERGVLV